MLNIYSCYIYVLDIYSWHNHISTRNACGEALKPDRAVLKEYKEACKGSEGKFLMRTYNISRIESLELFPRVTDKPFSNNSSLYYNSFDRP